MSRARWPRSSVALVAVVVAFWVVRVVWPAGGLNLQATDLRVYFYPTYDAFYGRLARGELLVWNPYQLCGTPWLGSPSGGYFYPPHVLYLVLPTYFALPASNVLHLLLAAVGTFVFVRQLGLTARAGFLAAVLFSCRGFLFGAIRWPYHLEAGSWLPLGCIAILALTRGQTLRATALLAGTIAMSWLAGSPQMTVFSVYAWGALLLALLPGAERRIASVGAFAAALALGTLAGAAQMVPSAELARTSLRTSQQLEPSHMFPLGDPGLGLLRGAIGNSQTALGLVGISLLPAALFARTRIVMVWALALFLLAFALALGRGTPMFQLYLALPVVGWFRGPYRLLFLVDFSFAVLAALAVDRVFGDRSAETRPLARRLCIATAVGLSVYAATIGLYGAAAATAAFALLLASPWATAPVAGYGALVLVLVELLAAPPIRSLMPYGRRAAAIYDSHAEAYRALAVMQRTSRVWVIAPALSLGSLAPRRATVHGVRLVDDYEPVTLRRHAEYLTYVAEGRSVSADTAGTFAGSLPQPPRSGFWALGARRHLLDLAAVGIVVVQTRLIASHIPLSVLAASNGFVPLPSPDPELTFWQNPHANPRAFVVYRTARAPDVDTLLAHLADPSFDPLALAYVEGAGLPPSGAAPRGHEATITRDEPHLVEVDATLAAPGLLVLADAFYPAWHATVDGTPAPILPTNHLFRGVLVPAGTHHVRFAYQATSLAVAAGVSLFGWLAIGLVALRGWRYEPARRQRLT